MSSITEVAKRAGVSIGTVSRVINNSGYVAEKTRQKVEAAIAELNYIPNEIARSFQRQSSGIIALVLPTIHHPLFSEFAYNLEKRLNHNGYKLLLCNSNFQIEKELEFLELLKRQIIDGIVIISNSDIDHYITADMPIVAVDRHFTNELAFISADNYAGGQLAAQMLVNSGCRKIAHIGGFPQVQTEVMKRRTGFIDFMASMQQDYILYESQETIHDEEAFVAEFVNTHADVDGIFSLTDMLAYKLLDEYQQRGIAVPQDVQVIGFDGFQVFNSKHQVLSTIRQPVDELGALAAETILQIVRGENVDARVILPITFRKGVTTR